jgi:hypothetical protein
MLWSQPIVGDPRSVAVASDGTIYVSAHDVFAFDAAGNQRWHYDAGPALYATVDDVNGGVVAISTGSPSHVVRLSAAGDLVWSVAVTGVITSSPTLDASGASYFGQKYTGVSSVSADGKLRWERGVGPPDVIDPIAAPPVLDAQGHLYVRSVMGAVARLADEP